MNDKITIKTNNQPRAVIYGFELTEKEQKEFDYLDFESEEGNGVFATFFRYKGELYNLADFVRIEEQGKRTNAFTSEYPKGHPLLKWDGICSDSYFSGLVVKLKDNGESVIVGMYTC